MRFEAVHGDCVAVVTQIYLENFWGQLNYQEGDAVRRCERPGCTAVSDIHIAGICEVAR